MTEATNKPASGGGTPGSGSRTITGARLASGTTDKSAVSGETPVSDGTRFRIVIVASGM